MSADGTETENVEQSRWCFRSHRVALVVTTPFLSTRADAFPSGRIGVPVSTVIAKTILIHWFSHVTVTGIGITPIQSPLSWTPIRVPSSRHTHFYGGYYYAWPWWYNSLYYYPRRTYAYGAHERWCLNRYRSYNPRPTCTPAMMVAIVIAIVLMIRQLPLRAFDAEHDG